MKNKPIFITGATGLLGSYLLRSLIQDGYTDIRALKRKTSSLSLVVEVSNKITWIDGDIRDIFVLEDAMKGVAQVYHCAAIVSTNPRDYKEMMEVNKEGTANVVNAALRADIDKLVHTSSIAAIGRRKKLKTINEKTKWQRSSWNSQYAISKYQSEMEVWRGAAEGLNVAVVNPSVIVGSGNWDYGIAPIMKRIWKGFKFYPVGGTGFVDVRDVARFMVKLMESEISNERYILNGANLSYFTFFELIAKAMNKNAPNVKVGKILKEMSWMADWLKSKLTGHPQLITKQSAAHTSRTFIYENEKSLQAFDHQYTPIEKTIAQMAKQFLEAATQEWQPNYLSLH